MKIAIHHREGSFSDRWIEYCERKNIDYKIVNCYDTNIIHQLIGCDVLMWHHHHVLYQDVLAARSILFSLEHANIKVFPDFRTAWHFDNKVAQKYLFEALEGPMVPSFVFYDKAKAMEWAEKTKYPKVFKLSGGAGAANVKLVRTKSDALKLIKIAFGKGFSQFDRFGYLKERIHRFKTGKGDYRELLKGLWRIVFPTEFGKLAGRVKGYIYFQEFIPNNDSDIRVIVIGNKAFALKRLVRDGDFRASGSGNIIYEKEAIDENCVKIAFDVNKKVKSQCVAFDFIFDKDKNPLIVEISYGFAIHAYDKCPGYWDENLKWHQMEFNPQEWIVENLIAETKHYY